MRVATARCRLSWVLASLFIMGCLGDVPEEYFTVEAIAQRYRVQLPPAGIGPIKAFRGYFRKSPGDEEIESTWLEWPDGTEILGGREYSRTRIVAIDAGKQQEPDFRYLRYEDDSVYAFDKGRPDPGEHYWGPRNREVGKRWRTKDAIEEKDCEVVEPGQFSLRGVAYADCVQVRCLTAGTIAGGTFTGEDLSTECSELGTVHLLSITSDGETTLRIENRLVDLFANGVEPEG